MWAEARKQEKKIRGIMVDHKKRAERRREYYEKIKQDPAQFLQITGRSCKLHIDHNAVAESSNTIMPWQGNANILIDRFDVRAHLDYIPDVQNDENSYSEESKEMRPMNYERYRILVQNNFLKIKEEKFLKTLAIEEKYGGKTYQQQKAEDDKKKAEKSRAAIGFTYEDSTPDAQPPIAQPAGPNDSQSLTDSDDDFDLDTVINFSALSYEQQIDLNSIGKSFFLGREDFVKYLKQEAEEQEFAKTAKAEEEEKSAFSGRKSRKERRILKEKRLAGRIPSPPSYATYEDSNAGKKTLKDSSSEESSRSASPPDRRTTGKVEYITTFGEEQGKKSSGRDKKSKKRNRRTRSSSSSSSSDDDDNKGGSKYRSKYRRKRRSSSSSSEEDKHSVVQPPPPPPIKRYYGRKREESDEEQLSEDSPELKTECSSYRMYSREDSNVSISDPKWPTTILQALQLLIVPCCC